MADVSPVKRPTEWTAAVVMLVLAVVAYVQDRNVAVLIAIIGAAVPVIVTALVEWWRSRKASSS